MDIKKEAQNHVEKQAYDFDGEDWWNKDSLIVSLPTEVEEAFEAGYKLAESHFNPFTGCKCKLYESERSVRLEQKILDLEYYKEQWQSIAGAANLKGLIQTIDNLVAANEAVHQDEIGTQVRLGEEKHRNEELELKILDLEKQIETLKTK
jgi:hypothetical protein